MVGGGGRRTRGEGAAHLFPLLSLSIAFPRTRDLVSSSCTSSSSVFLQVCLVLEQEKQTEKMGCDCDTAVKTGNHPPYHTQVPAGQAEHALRARPPHSKASLSTPDETWTVKHTLAYPIKAGDRAILTKDKRSPDDQSWSLELSLQDMK